MSSTHFENVFKRKFPRRSYGRSIGFLFRGEYYVGQGVEIGEGGLALMLPRELPKEAEGVASFQIPGGSFISLRVVLKNFETQGNAAIIGCSFKELQFEHKRQIRAYVSARKD